MSKIVLKKFTPGREREHVNTDNYNGAWLVLQRRLCTKSCGRPQGQWICIHLPIISALGTSLIHIFYK